MLIYIWLLLIHLYRKCFFTEENGTVSAEIIKGIKLEKAKAVEYPGDLWYTKGVRRETIQASLFERM